ncbi:diguanylate cyclase [Aurantimonas sp. C2-6-R+9]|uniref:GGDEF domain-containing protein n=1 Tax=unclassified Aurantimonas TaxID=2638230 RepID=UPI002E196035|nr:MULTISPECIES: diguanylate cyclase [unclassified Aurantimonas]MEC5292468.1 diguanylate cyclase [Aurantimonas sp. C2-3-R2]MEC5382597.1 diguanylate cyclase [Aurantimonas sp. C2-6-R+9]MEC5414760.1 diguanylate cyclase [Aurantimonas sp. C2-4-R8]
MYLPVNLILDLANDVGLLALLAISYGALRRARWPGGTQAVTLGLVFGAAAIATMLQASIPLPGIMIDARIIVVALAAAFGGPLPATIAAAAAGIYRIAVGGAGTGIGLAVLGFGVVAGLLWWHTWRRRSHASLASLFFLGLTISCQALLLPLLPIQASATSIGLSVAALMASCILATLLLGALMRREDSLIAREKSLLIDAFTDPLTGLANRRAFDQRLEEWTTVQPLRPFALMMIDVDHFKTINDRFGHDCGDRALAAVGDVLRRLESEKDMVARYGGEEFAVLLWNCDLPAAMRRAEHLRRLIAAKHFGEIDDAAPLTVSIGVSQTDRCGSPGSVRRDADAALYRAKAAGRNCVVAARKPRAARPRDGAGTRPSEPVAAWAEISQRPAGEFRREPHQLALYTNLR